MKNLLNKLKNLFTFLSKEDKKIKDMTWSEELDREIKTKQG